MHHNVVDEHQNLTELTRCWEFARVPYVCNGLCNYRYINGGCLNRDFKVVLLIDVKEFLYCAFKTVTVLNAQYKNSLMSVYITKDFFIL